MDKFTTLTGVAAPINMTHVDTDRIIPKNYLKTIKRTGLGKALFAEMRYDASGREDPEFVLNKGPFRKATIMVAGENFGCGSSREHAPWALLDFGIRCVIAPSFADIFFNNTFKNGILPIVLPEARVNDLLRFLLELPGAEITIDLPGPDRARAGRQGRQVRHRSLPQALPDQRSRRHRPHPAAGSRNRGLREQVGGGAPLAVGSRGLRPFSTNRR